jgi:hypothetical protein
MTALTNYTENKLIDHLFRTATFAKPTTLYVGLATAVASTETGSLTEVTGGSYARVARNPANANWLDASVLNEGTTSNIASIQFPTATADWGTITHIFFADALTGGNIWMINLLTNARTITNGTTPSFGAGALTFQVDN